MGWWSLSANSPWSQLFLTSNLRVSMHFTCFKSISSSLVPKSAECAVCGSIPTHRCHDCGRNDPHFQSRETHFLCQSCLRSVHAHPDRQSHNPEAIAEERVTEPVILELMSVVCIEKSHYVCFTRLEDSWVFFDSMADRTGM